MKRGFFRYRYLGNCFAVCFVNGCQALRDPNLYCEEPELRIFNIETLNGTNESAEFTQALNYLINKEYKVRIIDPDPFKDNNWGENLKTVDLEHPYRSYTKKDIESLNKEGWAIIISTLDTKKEKPHANLIFNKEIRDALNKPVWEKPIPWKNLEEIIMRKTDRFLIAFKRK